ncbi:MAG TPA: carboxymuconolactone decarboxylase family protein [Baekduia sp.]|nr:carboxymuconolactone decarboxylase family protein [Baekduia sp.]
MTANYERAFAHRPDVYAAWQQLNGAIKAGMDPRRYELATLAAALRLRSSYCALAHSSVMLDNGLADADELQAVVADRRAAGLSEAEVAIMDLAEQVAADAGAVTPADHDRLRALGLTDTDIFDVVVAASARCFFSKTLDAVGAEADAKYGALEPAALRDALTVGRPIASA